jgi:NitT/TauT family transport system substrate-binding protein
MEEITPSHQPSTDNTPHNPPPPKSKSTIYIAGFLAVLAVLAGAYLLRNYLVSNTKISTPVTSANTGPAQNVRVGNVGVYTIFNVIAKEKGYFEANGLNAQVTEFTSGPESLAGLLAGKTDINIAADYVGVRNIFTNPEIRILAQVNQHRIFQLAAKKDRIRSPQDLKGKKIGVTKNSAGEYFLGNFLVDNNLKLSDITLVDLTPAEMITQVANGTIDGMVVFEPHVYNLKKILGNNFIAWDIQGNQNISAVVFTTKAFIDQNPEVIKKYLQSLLDAEKYYQTHVPETKELVIQKFKFDKDYIEYSWPKLTHHITLNQELILGMEDEARWTIENKLTDKTTVPNYLEYIYFDGLSRVNTVPL